MASLELMDKLELLVGLQLTVGMELMIALELMVRRHGWGEGQVTEPLIERLLFDG